MKSQSVWLIWPTCDLQSSHWLPTLPGQARDETAGGVRVVTLLVTRAHSGQPGWPAGLHRALHSEVSGNFEVLEVRVRVEEDSSLRSLSWLSWGGLTHQTDGENNPANIVFTFHSLQLTTDSVYWFRKIIIHKWDAQPHVQFYLI